MQLHPTFRVSLDDITLTADGQDTYHIVKAAGRYRYYAQSLRPDVSIEVGYNFLDCFHGYFLLLCSQRFKFSWRPFSL